MEVYMPLVIEKIKNYSGIRFQNYLNFLIYVIREMPTRATSKAYEF
jgi:hypothetical protein